jgi:hypothetical protein
MADTPIVRYHSRAAKHDTFDLTDPTKANNASPNPASSETDPTDPDSADPDSSGLASTDLTSKDTNGTDTRDVGGIPSPADESEPCVTSVGIEHRGLF